MTNTYPYAPIRPREIPQMLNDAAFENGMESYIRAAGGKSKKTEILSTTTYQLTKRLGADLLQAERGPLEAVVQCPPLCGVHHPTRDAVCDRGPDHDDGRHSGAGMMWEDHR